MEAASMLLSTFLSSSSWPATAEGAGEEGSGERGDSERLRQPTTAVENTSSETDRERQSLKAPSARSFSGPTWLFTTLRNCSASLGESPAGIGVDSSASAMCW